MMIKEKYLTFENGKKYNPLSDENSMSVFLIKYQLCHCKIFCNYNSCQFLSGHKNSRFDPHGLYSLWNSPGQNTGVGSLSLLQGIFLTQESNWGLLYYRQILYQLSYEGSPKRKAGQFICRFKQIQSCFTWSIN